MTIGITPMVRLNDAMRLLQVGNSVSTECKLFHFFRSTLHLSLMFASNQSGDQIAE